MLVLLRVGEVEVWGLLVLDVGLIRDAIMNLKEQERLVLSLYYFEEMKLHQIAAILSLTESRVSQIRSKALGKLKVELGSMRSFVA
jgi:RNA polymerase sigma factor for flagellar operon FliA